MGGGCSCAQAGLDPVGGEVDSAREGIAEAAGLGWSENAAGTSWCLAWLGGYQMAGAERRRGGVVVIVVVVASTKCQHVLRKGAWPVSEG